MDRQELSRRYGRVPDSIRVLAQSNPTVSAGVNGYLAGHVNYEQALEGIIGALCEQNDSLMKAYMAARNLQPIIIEAP